MTNISSSPSQTRDPNVQRADNALHVVHEAHLAADAVEIGAHAAHDASHYAKHADAARKLTTAHSQMAQDLRKMSSGITALENVARSGGGAEAVAKLADARKAYQTAKTAFEAERPAVAEAARFLQELSAKKDASGINSKLRLGQAAIKLERALSASAAGRGLLATGAVVTNPAFARGLVVVGAGLEGYVGYADSTTQTTGGKLTNGALAGAGGALLMSNMWVAGADLMAPKGFKLSEIYRGGAGAVSSIAEGMVTGDTRGMDEFQRRSKNGDYGQVMKASSEAGDYWAKNGIEGGITKAWQGLKDFRTMR